MTGKIFTIFWICNNIFIEFKKVKVTPVPALRLCTGRTAHRGSRDIALPFHDHGTRRLWGVNVTPRPLFSLVKDPVPIVQEAGWAPGPVWTCAENLAHTGIRSPDRPACSQSLYINCSTRPLNSIWVYIIHDTSYDSGHLYLAVTFHSPSADLAPRIACNFLIYLLKNSPLPPQKIDCPECFSSSFVFAISCFPSTLLFCFPPTLLAEFSVENNIVSVCLCICI